MLDKAVRRVVGGFVLFYVGGEEMDRNAEGYHDPTAYGAIANIESKERARKVVAEILSICREYDFELVERVQIYDRKTGRVYK